MTQPPPLPSRRGPARSPVRAAVLGLLLAGVGLGLVAPSYGQPVPGAAAPVVSPVVARPSTPAPTFSAPYLNGVSGPTPARTVKDALSVLF